MAGKTLSRVQWRLLDRLYPVLEAWLHRRYSVLWVTLTSAPESPDIAESWRKLEKRVARQYGKPHYIAIRTAEGFGVLHMFLAFPRPTPRAAPVAIPYAWLNAQWQEIHGAWSVSVRRVGGQGDDAAKLARYAVAQYAAGQSHYLRCMTSQDLGFGFRISGMVKETHRLLKDMAWPLPWQASFAVRRKVVTDLLKRGQSEFKNRQIVLDNGMPVLL